MRDQLVVWNVSGGKEPRRIAIPRGQLPRSMEMIGNPEAGYEGLPPEYRTRMKDRMPEQPQMDPAMIQKMKETSHWIRTIALHPNGQIAAVGRSYEISLWDLQAGTLVRQFRDTSRQEAMARRQKQQTEERRYLEEASSMKSLLPFGLGAPSRSPAMESGEIVMMDDPSDVMDLMGEMGGEINGGTSLAFSPDGRLLVGDGAKGKEVWDVGTGQKVRPPKAPRGAAIRSHEPHGQHRNQHGRHGRGVQSGWTAGSAWPWRGHQSLGRDNRTGSAGDLSGIQPR